jgi:hypothetical protein
LTMRATARQDPAPVWNPAEVRRAYVDLIERTPLEATQTPEWDALVDVLLEAEERADMLAFRRAIGAYEASRRRPLR